MDRMTPPEPKDATTPPLAYKWPRYALGAVVLAIILAVVWMSYAVKRTRMIRDLNMPGTNSSRP